MKIPHSVPPLVVLLIVAGWLASMRESNRALERENVSLQKKIAESRNAIVRENEPASFVARSPKAKREKKSSETLIKPLGEFMPTASDFNELVLLNNNEGVRFNLTAACRRLETLVSEMSGDELARAYTQMASIPVDAPFRN
ncbi:MAG: hypothetical protein CFE26_05660, partial [Verrucomicrobiales bacterium VVV1]